MLRNKPIHIGYDVSQTGTSKAGCGFFSHAMIQAMLDLEPANRYSLYPSFGDFYFDALMPIKNPYGKGEYGPRHLTREMARTFWEREDTEALLHKPDIIHSNNFWCPLQITSSRLFYTFYDMGFVVEPDWTTEANRIGCFEGVFRSSIAADWIIAISEASRSHYLEIFPHFPKERIQVIYPCSRFLDPTIKGRPPKIFSNKKINEFWLSVGTIEPRKNQRRLAEAYARYLALGGKAIPLVLAGGEGWLMEDFQKFLSKLNIREQVIFTGYVSDEELIWLYRNCFVNLYPSFFEGFGLPILEGMQFGAPTLASNSTSMPEVSGKAAVLLQPEDIESWAQTMFRLIRNPAERENLAIAAKKQADFFNWKQSAQLLLDVYKEALAAPKRSELVTH